jgi:23S rRNA (cytidine1920-2'-O)/16S rRNA (cytidine1409-2'-O)-methyltransferase
VKKRLDNLIYEKGLAPSRSKAQALILAGQILVDGALRDKAGLEVDDSANIYVKESFPYVSRGALKIEKAYQEFDLDFKSKVILDIGSSTGGFSDFCLQHGAKRIYAVDVGRGQLDQKIRENDHVVVMERTDFRSIKNLSEKIDYFLCDVSFISLTKILPKIVELIDYPTEIIALVKPQFEAGAKEVSRGKGVVRDEKIRLEIIDSIKKFAQNLGLEIVNIVESPIKGAKGNVEYLMYLKRV